VIDPRACFVVQCPGSSSTEQKNGPDPPESATMATRRLVVDPERSTGAARPAGG
jgi:hypothetical protein